MELILTFANAFCVFLALVLLVLVAWGTTDFTKFVKERTRKQFPETADEKFISYDKRARGVNLAATLVILVGLVMAISWNVEHRKIALSEEAAFVSFTTALASHAKTEFQQLCTFNGFLASDAWIEKDSFPCKTVGNYRIWTTDSGSKRYYRPVGQEFNVGIVEQDGKITELTSTNLGITTWGIKQNYPATMTTLSGEEISALAKALAP
jgi:hypothetical protein